MAHILLYGGTFDPVHNGHLITCQAALEFLRAELLIFIPARVSPHKRGEPPRASGEDRAEMLRLATRGMPHFQIDARELFRQGPSYTIDTVLQIQLERPADHFTLLLGEDQLPKFHTWHQADALRKLVDVAVMPRPGSGNTGMEAVGRADAGLIRLPTPWVDISATEIRQRVGRGFAIDDLVPASVAAYIVEHRLYT
ncbi:MAG TPA: nicotinate (nicotinamide) nucleotide adenylyltransferase [Phycisphaerae bacterium]|jgi:nicotinate-nucleotide adenylyltransferase